MKAERINIAADNSCLFNAIYYLIEKDTVLELRQIVACIILSNPDIYNSIYLGKEVESYIEDILSPDQWGGAIELQILAQYYQIEIAAFNIESSIPLIYGEELGYTNRIYLIYNGIHYDSLVIKAGTDTFKIVSSGQTEYFNLFKELIEKYYKKGGFINLSGSTTQCRICEKKLPSAINMQKHAIETGHVDFQEIKKS
jgi:ubiquitin thioesterase OTU1